MIRNTRRRLAGRCATYGPAAAGRAGDTALYATLNAMLSLLHDSHTHALIAAQAGEAARRRGRAPGHMTRIDGGGW